MIIGFSCPDCVVTLESAHCPSPSSLIVSLTRCFFSVISTLVGRRRFAENIKFSRTVSVPMTTSSFRNNNNGTQSWLALSRRLGVLDSWHSRTDSIILTQQHLAAASETLNRIHNQSIRYSGIADSRSLIGGCERYWMAIQTVRASRITHWTDWATNWHTRLLRGRKTRKMQSDNPIIKLSPIFGCA